MPWEKANERQEKIVSGRWIEAVQMEKLSPQEIQKMTMSLQSPKSHLSLAKRREARILLQEDDTQMMMQTIMNHSELLNGRNPRTLWDRVPGKSLPTLPSDEGLTRIVHRRNLHQNQSLQVQETPLHKISSSKRLCSGESQQTTRMTVRNWTPRLQNKGHHRETLLSNHRLKKCL